MVGSHCRSDRLDRPDRPKFPDQARPTAVHDFSRPLLDRTRPPHDHSSTTSTRQPSRSLLDHPDPYTISTRPTRPLLNQYPITSRWLDLYSTNTRSTNTALIGKWSGIGRTEVELIGYWSVFFFYPDQTRSATWSFHDQLDLYSTSTWSFPDGSTSTQPIPDHFPMASWAIGFSISTRIWTCPKTSGRKPERCRAR